MKFLCAVFLLSLLFATAPAIGSEWVSAGPEIAEWASIVPDPQHSKVWYAVNSERLYRSMDAAEHWTYAGVSSVRQVLVHPRTSRVLVTVNRRSGISLYETRDSSSPFTFIASLPPVRIEQSSMNEHFLIASGYEYLPVARRMLLLVSIDGGRTWENLSNQLPIRPETGYENCNIYEIELDGMTFSPFESQTFFLSLLYQLALPCNPKAKRKVFKTQDLGKTWNVFQDLTGDTYFLPDPYFADRTFAVGSTKLYEFAPSGGLTYLSSGGHLPNVTFPENRNHLLSGIWESFDGGNSWRKRSFSIFPIENHTGTIAAMKFPRGGLLAAVVYGGIYKKIPGGDWKPRNKGIGEFTKITSVASNGDTAYAVMNSSFLYRSDNAGTDWIDLTMNLSSDDISDIAVHPRNPRYVIACFEGKKRRGFYLSKDAGKTWALLMESPSVGKSQSIEFDPADPSIVYFLRQYSVYKSVEGGFHPTKILDMNVTHLILPPDGPGVLYLVQCYALWKSIDGGARIHRMDQGITAYDEYENACLSEDMATPSTIGPFLSVDTASNISVSRNAGLRWQFLRKLYTNYDQHGDLFGGQHLYSADAGGEHFFLLNLFSFYETSDTGKSWTNLTGEFPAQPGHFNRFIEMTDPRRTPVFLATSNGLFMQN